jgi:hypothetical protein
MGLFLSLKIRPRNERKGIRSIFRSVAAETVVEFHSSKRGNASDLGDVVVRPGKSSLFFVRSQAAWKGFAPREGATAIFPQSSAALAESRVLSPALENPREALRWNLALRRTHIRSRSPR